MRSRIDQTALFSSRLSESRVELKLTGNGNTPNRGATHIIGVLDLHKLIPSAFILICIGVVFPGKL